MNPFLEKYITLKKQYLDQDGKPSSVVVLYDLADELAKSDDLEAKKVLVDLYEQLGIYTSAYSLFTETFDKPDRKQIKKLSRLQEMNQSHGDRFALPRPLTKEEKKQRQNLLKTLPHFPYHPDPLATGSFVEGEAKVCPSCGKESNVYYALIPYSIEDIENLCPRCIASGLAAQKFDAEFIQDAEWQGELDPEKNQLLFCQTPGYSSWQGEYWLSCCQDYCAYLGTVGTRELKAMGIAEQVLADYEAREEYQEVEDFLVKDGSICGYLFRCLHCQKYQIWVDAD